MEFHTDINRASVRRHAPPGGASSIHLGHDEPVQFKHAAPAINNIWGLERPDEIASKSPAKKPMRQYSNTKNNIFGGSDVHVEENVENKVNFDLNNHNNNMMLKNSIGNVVPPVMTKPIVQHVQQQQQPNVVEVPVKEEGGNLFSSMSQQEVPKTRGRSNNYQSSNLFAGMSQEEVSTKSRVKQAPGGTSSFSLY